MLAQTSQALKFLFQSLRKDFLDGAGAHPKLRHVIVQPLAGEGSVPPKLKKAMNAAGGSSAGEIRGRLNPSEYLLSIELPPQISYLYGPKAARLSFEQLAERAWQALPGSPEGKLQHFPQDRPLERWLDLVYRNLDACSSYFTPHDELWAQFKNDEGKIIEVIFRRRWVEIADHIFEFRYPDADTLPAVAERWRINGLAVDPFTASAAVVDLMMDDRRVFLSWQEADAYQASPEFQNADFLVDAIRLGERRSFPILRSSCRVVTGSKPTICPQADPPAGDAERAALTRYLPRIADRFRELRLVGVGQTIHWVGRQTSLGTLCQCNLGAGQPRRRGGRQRFEKSNPLLYQVYERIRREHQRNKPYRDTVDRLRGDKDFLTQVRSCEAKLNISLVRNALAFFERRDRRAQQTA